MRYRIDLSYDGAPFCGWQIQPSDPSVQEELEKALSTLLRSSVGVVGAGRTDTGVSATRYVAHFDFEGAIDCKQLAYKLNAILPKAISIQGIAPAADDFHARFDAVCRQYQYYIH
ncbi:MAG: tRNA pseudouridine synthase A, partial [Bacteroidales bacterium]|nr:tRNA pseudouridine synthase A [Bacteroidales bacterium]